MNREFDERDPDKEPDDLNFAEDGSENDKNEKENDAEEELGFEITEVDDAEIAPVIVDNDAKEAEDSALDQELLDELVIATQQSDKKKRIKKILLIVAAVLLGLALTLGGVGVFLFYHYYNKIDYQKPEEIDANERDIKLFDSLTGSRYTFTIDLIGLTDEETLLVDIWYLSNKELVLEIGKDPATMTVLEKEALKKLILEELRRLQVQVEVKLPVITVYNTVDGKEYAIEISRELLQNASDYAVILEYIALHGEEQLLIAFEGQFNTMTDEQKTALYAKIAGEIRDRQKIRYPLNLQDAVSGKQYVMYLYEEELSEEQAKQIMAMTDVLVLDDLSVDPAELDAEARSAFIVKIFDKIQDASIARYTILLRDPASGTVYSFVLKQNELTNVQLVEIVKQIHRGMLDLPLSSDPNLLDTEGKQQVVQDILKAIELLENPPKVYQITIKDRTSGKMYILSFDENEATDDQLITLLTKISEGAVILVPVLGDPALMNAQEKKALIEETVAEILNPSRALSLMDPATKQTYTLYFRDTDVSASQLSYLAAQMQTGKPFEINLSKDPASMTASEKAALLEAIITKLQAPPVVEYKFPVRDPETGTAYILVFTKDEIGDESVFGYLLEQAQKGTALDVAVSMDPSKMSAEDRKALFAAAVEAIKNVENNNEDPELLEKLLEHLNSIAQNPVQHTENIYNVLLVGTDERENYTAKNSDTMIVVTLNYKDKTITLTSLLRDTCVKFKYMSGGKEREVVTRLNSAYAIGGIKTLISAIESNYGLKIDNYVSVNWFSFLDVFEVLGGLEIDIPQSEISKINKVISLQSPITIGHNGNADLIIKSGKQMLNANQILAYCRYRDTQADFARTQRQRQVLKLVFEKFKDSDIFTINELLNKVLPCITTDLTEGNCAALLKDFLTIINCKMQDLRLPAYLEYTSKDGMLWPDWEKTLKRMYGLAYGSLCPEQYK
ncbi:MAG: hypothetical protein E7616_02260 [Ruminococcaceae bacterium]|nr:hypothetical protein [Oscillospiraceae bacterium]